MTTRIEDASQDGALAEAISSSRGIDPDQTPFLNFTQQGMQQKAIFIWAIRQ
jgi:hypothetical protein